MRHPSDNARCWTCGARAYDVANAKNVCGRCENFDLWIEPEITFRGCSWDDGWEFDCPTVLYSPFKGRLDHGSENVYGIVEDRCIDMTALGREPSRTWDKSDLKEFAWRGWSARGFAKRRRAWHVEIVVRFELVSGPSTVAHPTCEWGFEVVSHRERFGLSGRWEVVREVP